jgi:hypothetical protein
MEPLRARPIRRASQTRTPRLERRATLSRGRRRRSLSRPKTPYAWPKMVNSQLSGSPWGLSGPAGKASMACRGLRFRRKGPRQDPSKIRQRSRRRRVCRAAGAWRSRLPGLLADQRPTGGSIGLKLRIGRCSGLAGDGFLTLRDPISRTDPRQLTPSTAPPSADDPDGAWLPLR